MMRANALSLRLGRLGLQHLRCGRTKLVLGRDPRVNKRAVRNTTKLPVTLPDYLAS